MFSQWLRELHIGAPLFGDTRQKRLRKSILGDSAARGERRNRAGNPSLSADMRTLEIRHRTRYGYAQPVALDDYRLMLRPRDSHDLRLLHTNLVIGPVAQVRW